MSGPLRAARPGCRWSCSGRSGCRWPVLVGRVLDVSRTGIEHRHVRLLEGIRGVRPVRVSPASLGVVVSGLDPFVVARNDESARPGSHGRRIAELVHARLGSRRQPYRVGDVLEAPRRRGCLGEHFAVGERVHEADGTTEVPPIERLVCPLRIGDGIVLTLSRRGRVPDRAVLRPVRGAHVVVVEVVQVLPARIDRVQERHILTDGHVEFADPVGVVDPADGQAGGRRRWRVAAVLVDAGAPRVLRWLDELALGASERLYDTYRRVPGVADHRHGDRDDATLRHRQGSRPRLRSVHAGGGY